MSFVKRQIAQVREHGPSVLLPKAKRLFVDLPLFLVVGVAAIPAVLVVRIIRPWLLVRFHALRSHHIGHLAGDTELYLCERDVGINVPAGRYVDLSYMGWHPLGNEQLARMWRRVLRIWPAWLLAPAAAVNRRIPGGAVHEVGGNAQSDRDVHNLLDRLPPHLVFTADETARGQAGLRSMGIPEGAPYVCLIARDSAYTASRRPLVDHSFHDYRDCNIQNFRAAALELANRGYFVIRMGAKVHRAMEVTHARVLDYAINGTRSDFMDVYLGATCAFCVSSSTGFDSVPAIFRRPIAFVNNVPLGWVWTFRKEYLAITRRHVSAHNGRELTLSEIFSRGAGSYLDTRDYESSGITLTENTPEEIRDLAIEMTERLNGTWVGREEDDDLQQRFWKLFPADAVNPENNRPLHGEIRSRFGAAFLRSNQAWLK